LDTTKYFLDFEMNMGQMIEDVKLSLEGKGDVTSTGRTGA
jgi:2-oxoglutarate ferredoxin oxidoreductase subunit alpha